MVHFGLKGYEYISKLLETKPYSSVAILVDENTHHSCLHVFLSKVSLQNFEIIEIDAGEEHKHLQTCLGVWESMSALGMDRNSLLINLGGGVVTDLGGFVACAFKRGIDFVNVPTTLLAMVDASVGGKTGVDLGVLKNQIGIIQEPQMVLVDADYLDTLPSREYRSGYAEMLKHGLIADANYWQILSQYDEITTDALLGHIHHSVGIKSKVVSEDPNEKGLRKILNFGHTLGHALESYLLEKDPKQRLLHGEAIAVGMILEAFLSTKLCGLDFTSCAQIKTTFLSIYPKIEIDKTTQKAVVDLLKFDKKNSHGKVLFVLLKKIGSAVIDIEVDQPLIDQAFEFYLQD